MQQHETDTLARTRVHQATQAVCEAESGFIGRQRPRIYRYVFLAKPRVHTDRLPSSFFLLCHVLHSQPTFFPPSFSLLLLFLRLNSSDRRSAVPSTRTGNANVCASPSGSGQGTARFADFPGHGIGVTQISGFIASILTFLGRSFDSIDLNSEIVSVSIEISFLLFSRAFFYDRKSPEE